MTHVVGEGVTIRGALGRLKARRLGSSSGISSTLLCGLEQTLPLSDLPNFTSGLSAPENPSLGIS